MEIRIHNQTEKKIPPLKTIQSMIHRVCDDISLKAESIDIVFVDDNTLKNMHAEYVIVRRPRADLAGDNYCGEEFILWNIIVNNRSEKRTYIGTEANLNALYNKLKLNINQSFDKTKTKVIQTERIDTLFNKVTARKSSGVAYAKIENVEIYIHEKEDEK